MNESEARSVLEGELAKYRAKGYGQLADLVGEVHTREIAGTSGSKYQLEIEVTWDDPDKADGILRVLGSVDDGGFRTFLPVTSSILIAPGT